MKQVKKIFFAVMIVLLCFAPSILAQYDVPANVTPKQLSETEEVTINVSDSAVTGGTAPYLTFTEKMLDLEEDIVIYVDCPVSGEYLLKSQLADVYHKKASIYVNDNVVFEEEYVNDAFYGQVTHYTKQWGNITLKKGINKIAIKRAANENGNQVWIRSIMLSLQQRDLSEPYEVPANVIPKQLSETEEVTINVSDSAVTGGTAPYLTFTEEMLDLEEDIVIYVDCSVPGEYLLKSRLADVYHKKASIYVNDAVVFEEEYVNDAFYGQVTHYTKQWGNIKLKKGVNKITI